MNGFLCNNILLFASRNNYLDFGRYTNLNYSNFYYISFCNYIPYTRRKTMQQIAVIELYEYQKHETWKKPSHAWVLNTLEHTVETEKHYRLKFSHNEYNFSKWIQDKGGFYEWLEDPKDMEDIRFYPRTSDENVLPEWFTCFCQAMTAYLLEQWFKLQSVGNICHFFVKEWK